MHQHIVAMVTITYDVGYIIMGLANMYMYVSLVTHPEWLFGDL